MSRNRSRNRNRGRRRRRSPVFVGEFISSMLANMSRADSFMGTTFICRLEVRARVVLAVGRTAVTGHNNSSEFKNILQFKFMEKSQNDRNILKQMMES